jgi:plastocyanin
VWYQLWRAGALASVMGLLAIMAAGCAGSSDGKEGGKGIAASEAPSMDNKSQPGEVPNHIVIDNFTFNPSRLTVPAGTMVTWVNRDDVPHTATSTAKPKRFNSGTLDTDDQFSYVFTAPGTYDYFCAVHPKMTGQIVVK